MCPPGVDQTGRLPQGWKVLAPELLESCSTSDWAERDFNGGFFTESLNQFDMWGTLARPVYPISPSNQIMPGKENHPSSMSLGVFDILSNEIIDMIVENVALLDDKDLIALGLTCQRFWDLVVRHTRLRYVKQAAPWAGKMIVYQGSYSQTVAPPFRENEFALNITQGGYYDTRFLGRKFFQRVGYYGAPLETIRNQEMSLLDNIEKQLPESKIPESRWSAMKENIMRHHLFPQDREWVLRNLTTKEFVCASLADGASGMRLMDILMLHISWTDIPPIWDTNQASNVNNFEGKWAGHRFDIVTRDVLTSESESVETWKDATEAVIRYTGLFRDDFVG